jgi:hypothetical protein
LSGLTAIADAGTLSRPGRQRALGSNQSREFIDWLTIIIRCAHTSVAPGPMPAELIHRWQSTPGVVATGEHDRFFPPDHLRGPVRDRLDSDTVVLAGAGHMGFRLNGGECIRRGRGHAVQAVVWPFLVYHSWPQGPWVANGRSG